jgi:hypothetical protein
MFSAGLCGKLVQLSGSCVALDLLVEMASS